jgi:hypothetical protein
VLSRIDGLTSVGEIAHAGGIAPLEALRILSELYLRRAIAFDYGTPQAARGAITSRR